MSNNFKECSKCGKVYPLDGFNRRSASKDGRRPECRLCQSIEQAKYDYNPNKPPSRHEEYFKAKHGVSPGTVRSYVNRTYTFTWGELSEEEKLSLIEEYKEFRGRERITVKTKGYKVRIK